MLLNGKIFAPLLLIFIRFVCGILFVFFSFCESTISNWLFFSIIFLGLISDIFDGIIARKYNVSTIGLRRLDSQIDLVFWVCIFLSLLSKNVEIFNAHLSKFLIIIVLEMSCYVYSLVKFSKETCTHAYSAKFWGLSLFAFATELLFTKQAGFWFNCMWFLGLISHFDVLLIITILKNWQNDVPSFWHAMQIRKGKRIKKFLWFNS